MSGVPQYNRPHNGADAKDVMQPVVGDGSNIFDPEENRNDVFSETAKTRNTITHVPYRGNEQHGVEFNTPAEDFTPYESEENAHRTYTDPGVTPRDIVPMKPVPVQVVKNPDLIHPTRTTLNLVTVMSSGLNAGRNDPATASNYLTMIVQPQKFRKQLRIRALLNNINQGDYGVTGTTGANAYLSLGGGPNDMLPLTVGQVGTGTQAQDILVLDDYDGPVYAVVTFVNGTPVNTLPVSFIAIASFDTYEGSPLL